MYSMKPKFKDLKMFQEILKYADVNERVVGFYFISSTHALRWWTSQQWPVQIYLHSMEVWMDWDSRN